MQPWMWLAAYVLGFGLLQLLLYRHFGDRSPEPTEGRVARPDGGRGVAPPAADTVTCPRCGTVNEAHRTIRYCGGCVESLR